MEGLALIFTLGIIIVGGFLAWTYTKKGEEWLKTSNIQRTQIIIINIQQNEKYQLRHYKGCPIPL